MTSSKDTLLKFWEELALVTKLSFHAATKNAEGKGWNGKGKGEVFVTKEGDHCLLFHEKGSWQDSKGTEINFRNVFRWTLDLKNETLSLEHLRFGPNHPVFLFYLTPISSSALSSTNPHLCGNDTYAGQVELDPQGLKLCWHVTGPKKNEELETLYLKD